MHDATGAEYIAGFWQPLNAFDLAWRGAWDATQPEKRHRAANTANPSRSWTPLVGHVYPYSSTKSEREGTADPTVLHASATLLYDHHPSVRSCLARHLCRSEESCFAAQVVARKRHSSKKIYIPSSLQLRSKQSSKWSNSHTSSKQGRLA